MGRNKRSSSSGAHDRARMAEQQLVAESEPAAEAAAPARKQRSLGDRISRAIPYIGLVIGLLIIGYYPASEAWDAWQRSQEAEEVDSAVASADDEAIAELFAQAEAYNDQLAGLTPDIDPDDIWPYEDQLSLTGHDTAFGYVIIPEISLTMPIYHGTDDAALSAGAGHLETSSLPIGGESTHAVITAHSGMSGMRAFDDIDQLEVGDVFGVKVLGELCCYEVTSIEVVWPDEVDSLEIQAGEDLCTLVTCTPYGVNDHRLLVHGQRCEVPDWFDDSTSSPLASVVASDRMLPFLIAFAVVAAVLVLLAAWQAQRRRKARKAEEAAAAGSHTGS